MIGLNLSGNHLVMQTKNTKKTHTHNHICDCEEPNEDGKSTEADEDDIEDALEKVTLKVFKNDIHAYRRQVRYMTYLLCFTELTFKRFSTG